MKFEGFRDDVIGSGEVSEAVEKLKSAPRSAPVHPLVSLEQLERGSPTPFVGRPDPDYPELDSGEPLYTARFLLRRWGAERFRASTFYTLWRSEAERTASPGDAKPGKKK